METTFIWTDANGMELKRLTKTFNHRRYSMRSAAQNRFIYANATAGAAFIEIKYQTVSEKLRFNPNGSMGARV